MKIEIDEVKGESKDILYLLYLIYNLYVNSSSGQLLYLLVLKKTSFLVLYLKFVSFFHYYYFQIFCP